jgi:hypothetical protein
MEGKYRTWTLEFAVIEYLGWAATAVFVGSYLCKRSEALRRVQMLGALIWVVYGLFIQAMPVVAANLLVFSVAGWTLLSSPGRDAA